MDKKDIRSFSLAELKREMEGIGEKAFRGLENVIGFLNEFLHQFTGCRARGINSDHKFLDCFDFLIFIYILIFFYKYVKIPSRGIRI